MSCDLLLDIGTSKAILAPMRGSVAEEPVIIRRSEESPSEWIAGALRSCSEEVASVLVASTGLVRGGRIFSGSLGEVDVLALAEETLGAPALVVNDGHAVALAAARSGYVSPLLAVHVGTGLAAGFWNEELLQGASGFAGEVLYPAGGADLSRVYKEITGQEMLPEKIARLAGEGNEDAVRATGDAAAAMADEICRMIYFADPATVVLSGGEILEAMQPWLLPAIWERLRGPTTWQEMLADRNIEVSPLGPWAPLYGAACLAAAEPDFSAFL